MCKEHNSLSEIARSDGIPASLLTGMNIPVYVGNRLCPRLSQNSFRMCLISGLIRTADWKLKSEESSSRTALLISGL